MNGTEHSPLSANQVSAKIDAAVEQAAETLLEVSHAIHDKPELAFEEHFACEVLAKTLRDHNLSVATGVYSLETAFETTINSEQAGPTVAVLAEYDALPQIGHACGHNVIATSALGATLALDAVAAFLPGRVDGETAHSARVSSIFRSVLPQICASAMAAAPVTTGSQ